MGNQLNNALSDIFKIMQIGKLGKEQVINISANTLKTGKELEDRINTLLCMASCAFNTDVKKETVKIIEKPYRYGVLIREYVGGAILKIFLRCAPIQEYFEMNVYGSDGELFYDSRENRIIVFEQIPDNEGTANNVSEISTFSLNDEEFWQWLLNEKVLKDNRMTAKQVCR